MATALINRIPSSTRSAPLPLIVVPVMAVLLFLALPWSIEHKAHMALHGLCAQQPSHTYTFGDRHLPFDARMTGIYTGYLVTSIVLFRQGAHRWCRPPSISRLLVLGVLGGAMAFDGVNSFLIDVDLPHLYESRNWLRLTTGLTAGVVLGFALCFLMASSLWKRVDTRRQTLEKWSSLPVIGLSWIPIATAVITGWGPLYVLLTLWLIVSAALALTSLALVVLVILSRRDFSFEGPGGLRGFGVGAFAIALIAMAALAAGRALFEQWAEGPPLT